MGFHVNLADYVQPPKMDVVHAIALVAKLGQRAPSDAPHGVTDALERLRVRAESLNAAWVLRAVKPMATVTKPQVVRLVGTWGALQGRLIAWTRIPLDAPAESAEAQRLLDEVLGNGLRFLKMERDALWVESARRIALLDDPSRAPQVEALAGATFVEAVRVSHKLCGDALGLNAAEEREEGVVDLMAPLNEVRSAVAAYALQLLAATDEGNADAVARSLHALAPIDDLRVRARDRRAGERTGDEPVDDDNTDGAARPADPAQPVGEGAGRDAQPANDNPETRATTTKRRVASRSVGGWDTSAYEPPPPGPAPTRGGREGRASNYHCRRCFFTLPHAWGRAPGGGSSPSVSRDAATPSRRCRWPRLRAASASP